MSHFEMRILNYISEWFKELTTNTKEQIYRIIENEGMRQIRIIRSMKSGIVVGFDLE